MADFSSALYLGMHHATRQLAPWRQLSLGKPAALAEPCGARELAGELAALQGCAAASLLPSTLHLFFDLFRMLARVRCTVLVDGGAYPLARWGGVCAAALAPEQMRVQEFAAGSLGAARRVARHCHETGRMPVILADGYTPGAARPPPLAAYAALAQATGGCLVLDDTQALGVLGEQGSGSPRLHRLQGMPVLVGASLAKGFGVPLAVLAGETAMVARFEAGSAARLHCSPPSLAQINAGQHALLVNRNCGDGLRAILRQRCRQFRRALVLAGLRCEGGEFPVQRVLLPPGCDGFRLHAALRRRGVQCLLQDAGRRMALMFLLRADHTVQDVALATMAVISYMKELA
ncbi:hypothetical protein [Massilia sp. erpn]|uniref:hypothetical protein n=1 Tax=Massilia sp. erpn TaxID=2738142 RepID=UPI002103CD8E|nr:hypothetical protein [Massilia sp. erpn]UTY59785.1 pyridoxal phosphate-dependent aminotransferase family protein [Massilia sp. erpn]